MVGGDGERRAMRVAKADGQGHNGKESCGFFKIPLHFPRYTKAEYETMPEWKLDGLLREYGLPVTGDIAHKRSFAMGAFLWPSHG